MSKENIVNLWNKTLEFFKNKIFTNTKPHPVRNYFLFVLAILLCFLTPSILCTLLQKNYSFRIEFGFLELFIPLALALAAQKNKKFVAGVLSVFIVMELIQLSHMFYFGLPISPFSIEMIWIEGADVVESAIPMILKLWFIPFMVLVPYGLLIWLFFKFDKERKQFYFPVVIILLVFAYMPHRLFKKPTAINNMMPVNDRITVYNDLRAFSGFLFHRLPRLIKGEITNIGSNYQDFIVEKESVDGPINVIIIMGESVNVNHMSLFGYEKETTPLLEKMVKSGNNYAYKRAYSSSVLTRNSTMMFFNVQREPDNRKHLLEQKSNLFRLAKENDFNTLYISAQTESLLFGMAPNYIDTIITREKMPSAELDKNGELYLLEVLQPKLDKLQNDPKNNRKNFIVLHQRHIHSPYEKNYVSHPEYAVYPIEGVDTVSYRVNGYDNAMYYNDYILSNIFKYFAKSTVPTYVFFVPDHSELLGKNGKFGHSILDRETAEIPFIAAAYNMKDNKFIEELKEL